MGYAAPGPTGRTRWRRRLFHGPIYECEMVENRIAGQYLVWRPATPSAEQALAIRLLARLMSDDGWAACEPIFRSIFPDLGKGPFSGLGKTQPPSAWREDIRAGLASALQTLADGPQP